MILEINECSNEQNEQSLSIEEIGKLFGFEIEREVVPGRITPLSISHSENMLTQSDDPNIKKEKIEGVIVYNSKNNSYWQEGISSATEAKSAFCFSSDGIRPADVAGRQAQYCSDCDRNKYGSAINGKGKACRNMRLLHILIDSDNIFSLNLPPSSLKSFSDYNNSLSKERIPIQAVITEIGLERKSFSGDVDYSIVIFKKKKLLTNETKLRKIKDLVERQKRDMKNNDIPAEVEEAEEKKDNVIKDPF